MGMVPMRTARCMMMSEEVVVGTQKESRFSTALSKDI